MKGYSIFFCMMAGILLSAAEMGKYDSISHNWHVKGKRFECIFFDD